MPDVDGAPGSRFQLIALPDADSVSERVASLLLAERRFRPERPLGLATGRTMEPIYAALVRQLRQLPFSEAERLRERWLSFNLDEYLGLPQADRRRFRTEMLERLADPLGLDPERLRLPRSDPDDPSGEARRYAAELEAAGGLGLQLLGLGLNGHIGFNEPPCGADAPCRCVRLSPSTRRANAAAFGSEAAVPEQAITLGLREILAARRILLVVTGENKREVLERLLREPPGEELPASWLQRHPDVTVIADRAALGSTAEGDSHHPAPAG